MAPQTSQSISLGLSANALVMAVVLALLWYGGFLSVSQQDSDGKVIAATLALIGVLFTASVSVIGMLLKHSIEKNSETRQQEAESRLKLEAAIRAVQLFSTNAGKLAPSIQRAGALFTLTSLDQHDLTLSLLNELLTRKDVEAGTATSIMNHAFTRGNASAQTQAVMIFVDHAEEFITPSGVAMPEAIADWDRCLSPYVREWAPIALAKMLMARAPDEWGGERRYEAYGILASLGLGWHRETGRMKNAIGALLREMVAAFPETTHVLHPSMTIDFRELRKQIATASPTGVSEEIVERLVKWRSVQAKVTTRKARTASKGSHAADAELRKPQPIKQERGGVR